MFISNHLPSFYLWEKENLINHLKVSKYYQTDSLKTFLLFVMLLLAAKSVKTSDISTTILFIFLKKVLKETWNSFNTKSQTQWKDRESSNQVRQSLGLFYNLNALILGSNSVKGIRVTKNFKEVKFEEVWGKLESRKCFQRQ